MSFNYLSDDLKRDIFQTLARKNAPATFNRKFFSYTQGLVEEGTALSTAFNEWQQMYNHFDEMHFRFLENVINNPNSSPEEITMSKRALTDTIKGKAVVINNLDISAKAKNELLDNNQALEDYVRETNQNINLPSEIDNIASATWSEYIRYHTNEPKTRGFFEVNPNNTEFYRLKQREDVNPEETQLFSQIEPALNSYYTQMFINVPQQQP